MNLKKAKTPVATTEALSKHETQGAKITANSTATQAANAFDTLRARAALHKIALIASTDDRDRPLHVASRWAHCKSFDSIPAVTEWLQQVTGACK